MQRIVSIVLVLLITLAIVLAGKVTDQVGAAAFLGASVVGVWLEIVQRRQRSKQ